jgi:hypothetical protein
MIKVFKLFFVCMLICFAFSSAQADIYDGLVAYYPFNGNADDESGNGNNGTVNGATLTADRNGNANSAYSFDGENDYIQFSNVPTTVIDNWTISGWINPSSLPQLSAAVYLGYDNGLTGNGYGFGINNGGVPPGVVSSGNVLYGIYCGVSWLSIGYSSLNINTWYQVVMIRNNGFLKFYINNNLYSINTNKSPIAPSVFYIGSGTGIRYFNGLIDDIRIYNRALTQPEINELYFLGSGQIVENVTEQNTQTSDIIALKDLIKKDGLYYGVDDNTLYVSQKGDKYISLYESNNIFNALAATKNHIIAVGESGQVILYNITDQSIVPIDITDLSYDLLDIDSNGNDTVMIAGQYGTIVKGNENNFTIIDTDYGDITSMTFDKSDNKFYATTSNGKLLSSTDGETWNTKHITDNTLTSFEKKGQIIVVTGENGIIYRSDNGREFVEATSNTTDRFVDVWYINDRFVAATQDAFFSSDSGHSWLKMNQTISNATIFKLFLDPNDQNLFVLTSAGIRKMTIFKNIETGKTKKATLAGVNVIFDKSEIEFEQGQIKSFNIEESDTMHIYDDSFDNELAYIELFDASFHAYSENNSTLDSILFKKQSYVEISGKNNILYYKAGTNELSVSQGSFWLVNKQVHEKPLFHGMSDNTDEILEQEIKTFINTQYKPMYNNASEEQRDKMASPFLMFATLNGLHKAIKVVSKIIDIPLTGNLLLLGDLNTPFSPIYLSSPFFRRLHLDTSDGKIFQKDSYLFGTNFMIDTLLSKLKTTLNAPKLEYTIDKSKMKGNIKDFKLEIKPIILETKEASIEVDLDDKDATNTISINDATFSLTTKAVSKYTQNDSSFGFKVSSLKFAHDQKNGFKLISGEAGGQVNIKELSISPAWTLKDIHTYFNFVFREKNMDDVGFNDKYSNDLDEILVVLGGKGQLLNQTNKLTIDAELEVALDGYHWGFDNFQTINFSAKEWLNFPKKGAFSLTGVGGGYQFIKDSPSFWYLTAGFSFYKAHRNVYLFGGDASIYASSDFDSFGFSVTDLKTPIPGIDLEMKWSKKDASICLLSGIIRKSNPVKCPDINDCYGNSIELKPSSDDDTFNGTGLGAEISTTLMNTKKNKPYQIMGVAEVKDILSGSLGLKLVDVENKNGNKLSARMMAKVEVKLPKITKDWWFIPSDLKTGKTLGMACLELGSFEISQEYTEWFSTKTANLGKHIGIYAIATLLNKKYPIFIPLDYLTDKDYNQLVFVTNMTIKPTDVRKRQRNATPIGQTINDSFTLSGNEPFIKVDFVSTDNALSLVTPNGITITQDSANTNDCQVDKIDGQFTVISIADPDKGTYYLSYQHTGNERITIFGANQEPQGTISLANQTSSFQLTDTENDSISYEIGLADENDNEITVLKPETTYNGETSYDIADVSYLPSGNYRVFMRYHDSKHPHKICMTTETIYIEKEIPQPQNIQSIITDDYVDIQWDYISGTAGYTVTLYNDNTPFYEMPTKSNQSRIYYLNDGTYRAEIQGYDMDGFSGPAGSIQFSVQKQAAMIIPKPVDDVGFQFDGTEARLTWNQSQYTDFYQITLKKGSQIILDQLITSQTYYTVDPSFYGEQLYIEITSKNASNNSSEIFSKTIPIMDDTDSDQDNLPDMWEICHLNTLAFNGTDDFDLDGLSNASEFTLATNPIQKDTDQDMVIDSNDPHPLIKADKNQNILSDDWEKVYTITHLLADDDNDTYQNYIEYLAGWNPNKADPPDQDISRYKAMAFPPVIISNMDQLSICRINQPLNLDLSQSFDVQEKPLSFSWKVNTDPVPYTGNQLIWKTDQTGMIRIEVTVKNDTHSVYRQYSVFVTDGTYKRADGAGAHELTLSNYQISIPAGAMNPDSYVLAADISHKHIPIKIMGRKIVTHGLVLLYSDNHKLESPVDIIPYVKDDDIIDPYIFNYGSSIWTDLVTGETFDPIYRKRMIPNDDQSYKIQTKETGILVFANRPDPIELKPVTQIFATNRVYYVDLASYQQANGLQQITDITLETNGIVDIYRGLVSENDEIRLDVIQPGRTEISIVGINQEGNNVRYTYLLDIIRTPPENNLTKVIAALQICAGIDQLYDLSDIDMNQDNQISLIETIYWLQKVSKNER